MRIFQNLANKKGQSANGVFALMVTAAIAVSVMFIALTLSADIMQGVQDTQTAGTAAHDVSANSTLAIGNLANQGGNIGLIMGVGFLLLVLIAMFGKLAMGSGGSVR